MTKFPGQLFDLTELQSIAEGNDEFVSEMVTLFISETETALPEIKTLIASGDFVRVKAMLHKMKPSIMVMGIHEAGELISFVQKMDLGSVHAAEIAGMFLKIEAILSEANEQLKRV